MDLAPRKDYQRELVNLRPPFLQRYRYPVALVTVAIVASSLLYARYWTQGAEAYFYPGSCLGTWKHIARAEGKPQALEAGEVQPSNAALFDPESQEIYCGGFAGDIPEGANVTRMQLRLVWRFSPTELQDEQKVVVPADPLFDAPASAPPIPEQVIDAQPSTTIEFEIKQIEPDGTPIQDGPSPVEAPASPEGGGDAGGGSESGGASNGDNGGSSGSGDAGDGGGGESSGGGEAGASSWIAIPLVHAQEEPATPPPAAEPSPAPEPAPPAAEPSPAPEPAPPAAEPSPAPEPASEQQPPAAEEPVQEESAAGTASGTGDPVPATPVSIDQPVGHATAPLDAGSAFLAVSYTLDGQAWNVLKNVDAQNWNESVDLPITQWADIAKLQVKIERLPNLDDAPYVYLDGIVLAAQYDDGTEMEMPDLENDIPLSVLSNEQYVAVSTRSHAEGKNVLWLFERSGAPQWLRLADEDTMASSTPIGLHGPYVIWLSRDRRSLFVYQADTKTSFSQTLDGRDSASFRVQLRATGEEAVFQGESFSFVDAGQTVRPSDNDEPFSSGFWEYVRALHAGMNATTTEATSTAGSAPDAGASSTATGTVLVAEPAVLEESSATTTAE